MTLYRDLPGFVAAHPNASGLARLRRGAAWTDMEDAAFALGYPIVRFLDTATEVDVDAAVAATQNSYPAYALRWPAELAARLLRAWGVRRGTPPSTSVDPITVEEARGFEAKFVVNGAGGAYDQNEDALLLLEAFVGPSVVVDAALSALEELNSEGWRFLSHVSYAAIVPLGVLLCRLPASEEATARARFGALLARHADAKEAYATRALRLVVEGASALEEAGHRLAGGKLNARFAIAADDPGVLLPVIEGDEELQGRHEARLAYLAGDAGVLAYAANWSRAKKAPAQARLLETFGALRGEAVVQMILQMVAASKAKSAAQTWCNEHPAIARAEFAKVTGDLATAAAALSKKLPKG